MNRNSLRAASYCAFKTMTDLNSLKPGILSFIFEAVAKTCKARLYEVGAAASSLEYLQSWSLPLLSLLLLSNRQDKLQVLWWRLGHGSTKAVF